MTNNEFRQKAAIAAMQGILANPNTKVDNWSADYHAEWAHKLADAMLAERTKRYGTVNESLTVDDWIEWHGGECPVDSALPVIVEYQMRNGEYSSFDARILEWQHAGSLGDIIRYRVVAPQGDE